MSGNTVFSRLLLTILSGTALSACTGSGDTAVFKDSTPTASSATAFDNPLREKYPQVPDERILSCGKLSDAVYGQLKERYVRELRRLKAAVSATGSRLIVVIATPEVHATTQSPSNTLGLPFIRQTLRSLGIESVDVSGRVQAGDPAVLTLMPRDGHWSEEGAKMIADAIAVKIRNYDAYKSTQPAPAAARPETFGDEDPGADRIQDGGKDLPYRVVTNKQGLRMNADVSFPKTKQRILLLGDSELFFPFLDNEKTGSAVLQRLFPGKEILNAARMSYSVNDYASLFEEKARYAEPDLVFVGTNGNDILDLYFSNRNKVSREKKQFQPTPDELKLYDYLFGPEKGYATAAE